MSRWTVLFSSVIPAKLKDKATFMNKNIPINPFAPGDFAEKRVLKLVEWFSGHCPSVVP